MGKRFTYNPLLRKGLDLVEEDGVTDGVGVIETPAGPVTADSTGKVYFTGDGLTIDLNGPHGVAFKADAKALEIEASGNLIIPDNGRWKLLSSDDSIIPRRGSQPGELDLILNPTSVPSVLPGSNIQTHQIPSFTGKGSELTSSVATVSPDGNIGAKDISASGDIQGNDISSLNDITANGRISGNSLEATDLGDPPNQHESVVVTDANGKLKRITLGDQSFVSKEGKEIVQTILSASDGIEIAHSFDTNTKLSERTIRPLGFLKSLYNMSKVSALKSGFVVLRSDGTAQAIDLIAGNGIQISGGDGSDPSGTTISLAPSGGLKNSEYGVAVAPTQDRTFGGLGNNAILNWPVTTIHSNGIAFNVDPTYGWLFENTMGDGFYIFNVNLRFFSSYATSGIKEAPISVIINILNPDNTISNRLVRDITFSGNVSSPTSELLNSLDVSDVLYLHSKQKIYLTVDMSAATAASDITSIGINGTINTLTYGGYVKTYLSLVPILGAGASNPAQQADVGCIVTLTQDELPPAPIANISHITQPYFVRYTKDVIVENNPAKGWIFKASSVEGLYSVNGELAFEANFTQSTGTETISVDVYLVHEDSSGTVINKWMISHHPLSRPLTPTLTQIYASVPISVILHMNKGDAVYFELTVSPPAAQASGAVVSLAGRLGSSPEAERTFISFTKHSSGSQGGDGDVTSSVTAPVTTGSIPVFDDPAGKVISNTEVTIDANRNISNVNKIEADEMDLSKPLDLTSGGTGASILPDGVVVSDGSILDTVDSLIEGEVLTSRLDSQGNMTYGFERPTGGVSSDTSSTEIGDVPVYDSTDGRKITKSLAKITGGTLSGIDELDGPFAIKGTVTLRDTPGRQADLDIERGNLNVNGVTRTTDLNVTGDSVLSGNLTVSSLPSPGGTSDSPNSIATLDATGKLQRFNLNAQDSFLARHDGDLMHAAFSNDPDGSLRFTSKVIGTNVLYSFVADGLLASIHSLGKRIISKQAQPGVVAVKADGTATSLLILGSTGISVTTSESSAGKVLTIALSVLRDATNGFGVILSPASSAPLQSNTPWYITGAVETKFQSPHVEFIGDNNTPWEFKAKTDGVYHFSSAVILSSNKDAYSLKVSVEITRVADVNNKEIYLYDKDNFSSIDGQHNKTASITDNFYLNVNDSIKIQLLCVSDPSVSLTVTGKGSTTQYATRASLVLTAPNVATSRSTGSFGGITPGSGAVATPDTVNDRIGLIGEGIVNTYTKTGDANNVYTGTTGTAQNQIFGVGDAASSPNFAGKAFSVQSGGLVRTLFSGSDFTISTSAFSASLDSINGVKGFVYSDGTTLSGRQIDVLPQGIATLDTTTNPPQFKFTGRLPSLEALPSSSNGVLKVNQTNGVSLVEQPMGPQADDSIKILAQVGDDPKFIYLRFPTDGLWLDVDTHGNAAIRLSDHLLELENIPDSATGLLWKDNTSNTFVPVNIVGGTNVSVDSSQLRNKGIITINAAGGGGDLPPAPIIPSGNELPDPNPSSASYAGLVFNRDSIYDDTQEDTIPISVNGKDKSIKYVRGGSTYAQLLKTSPVTNGAGRKVTQNISTETAQIYPMFKDFNSVPSIPFHSTTSSVFVNFLDFQGLCNSLSERDVTYKLTYSYRSTKKASFYIFRTFSGKSSTICTFYSSGNFGYVGNTTFEENSSAYTSMPGFDECVAASSSKLNYYSLNDVSSGVSNNLEVISLSVNRQLTIPSDTLPTAFSYIEVGDQSYPSVINNLRTFNLGPRSGLNSRTVDSAGRIPKTGDYQSDKIYSPNKVLSSGINWFTAPSDGMYIIKGVLSSNVRGSLVETNGVIPVIGVNITDKKDIDIPFVGKSKTRSYALCKDKIHLTTKPSGLPDSASKKVEKTQFYLNKGDRVGFFVASKFWNDIYPGSAIPYSINLDSDENIIDIYSGTSIEIEQIFSGGYSPINEKIPGSNEFTSDRWMKVELKELINIPQAKPTTDGVNISTYKIDGIKSVIGKATPTGDADIMNANAQIVPSQRYPTEIYHVYFQMDIKMNAPIEDIEKLPTRCFVSFSYGEIDRVYFNEGEITCIKDDLIHIFFASEISVSSNSFTSIYITFENSDIDFTWSNVFNENGITSVKPTILVYDTGKHTSTNPIPPQFTPNPNPSAASYVGLKFDDDSIYTGTEDAAIPMTVNNIDVGIPYASKGIAGSGVAMYSINGTDASGASIKNSSKFSLSGFNVIPTFSPLSVLGTTPAVSVYYDLDSVVAYGSDAIVVGSSGYKNRSSNILRPLSCLVRKAATLSMSAESQTPGITSSIAGCMSILPGFTECSADASSKLSYYGLSDMSSGVATTVTPVSILDYSSNCYNQTGEKSPFQLEIPTSPSSDPYQGINLAGGVKFKDQAGQDPVLYSDIIDDTIYNLSDIGIDNINWLTVPSDGIYIMRGRIVGNKTPTTDDAHIVAMILDSKDERAPFSGKSKSRSITLGRVAIDDETPDISYPAGTFDRRENAQLYLRKDEKVGFFIGGGNTSHNIYRGTSVSIEQIVQGNYSPINEKIFFPSSYSPSRWMHVYLKDLSNISQAAGAGRNNETDYKFDGYRSIIGKGSPAGVADLINSKGQIVNNSASNKYIAFQLKMDIKITSQTNVAELPTRCFVSIINSEIPSVTVARFEVGCVATDLKLIHIFANGVFSIPATKATCDIIITFEDADSSFAWTNKFTSPFTSVAPELVVYETDRDVPSNPASSTQT